ncbi:hypothetical protein GCM10028857_03510 [Salinarchaeum chitinilyticum]
MFQTSEELDEILKFPCDKLPPDYEAFAEILLNRVENNLRLLCYYDEYGITPFLLHEEQCEQAVYPRVMKLHRRAIEDFSITGNEFDDVYGDLEMSIFIHVNVIVICCKEESENRGLIATIDQEDGLLSILKP